MKVCIDFAMLLSGLVYMHGTSIKYKVERDKRYLPYIKLGRWLCSHIQLETPLNF